MNINIELWSTRAIVQNMSSLVNKFLSVVCRLWNMNPSLKSDGSHFKDQYSCSFCATSNENVWSSIFLVHFFYPCLLFVILFIRATSHNLPKTSKFRGPTLLLSRNSVSQQRQDFSQILCSLPSPSISQKDTLR